MEKKHSQIKKRKKYLVKKYNPMQAVKTNIEGTDNVLHAAIDAGVKRVVCLSTGKVAYPNNAMGISKVMMDRVIYANARVTADYRGLNYDKYFVKGQVQTEADESYTSHNTTLLDVVGVVKKILTTDYVQEVLQGISHNWE